MSVPHSKVLKAKSSSYPVYCHSRIWIKLNCSLCTSFLLTFFPPFLYLFISETSDYPLCYFGYICCQSAWRSIAGAVCFVFMIGGILLSLPVTFQEILRNSSEPAVFTVKHFWILQMKGTEINQILKSIFPKKISHLYVTT